jgi:hypothetical protein
VQDVIRAVDEQGAKQRAGEQAEHALRCKVQQQAV